MSGSVPLLVSIKSQSRNAAVSHTHTQRRTMMHPSHPITNSGFWLQHKLIISQKLVKMTRCGKLGLRGRKCAFIKHNSYYELCDPEWFAKNMAHASLRTGQHRNWTEHEEVRSTCAATLNLDPRSELEKSLKKRQLRREVAHLQPWRAG